MMHKWIFRLLLGSMLAFIAVRILAHPLATNDGPVHLAFSHLMLTYHQPSQPLQSQAYVLNLKPNPNLGVYFLMATLMRVFSPTLTESIIQLLCIFGTVCAGYFALHTIDPKNVWLSIFLLPLALNQMLFLGLYNHSMSIGVFFLVIGTFFWMSKAPTYLRALALSGTLILTFLCHASGFIMAFSGLAAMTATQVALAFYRDRRVVPALWAQRHTILAMVIPLPLGAVFLLSGHKSSTRYSETLPRRIWQFAKLHILTSNYPLRDRYPAAVLSILLMLTFGYVAVRILRKRRDMTPGRRDQAIGVIAATFLAIAIMLAFPDIMGGGWTHFRRFEIFPYFWMVILLAFEDFSAWAVSGMTAVGASVVILIIASLFARQRMIREQMAPLAVVDSLVGSHCSVLPVVLQPFLLNQYSSQDWMMYEPFYQTASHLELRNDRVVLFNYLARLPPYPVHFRPGIEPQEHIFGWEPEHIANDVEKIDIPGFEAGSGMRVDYILLWGDLDQRSADMHLQVQKAISQFNPVYQSPNGNVKLYRRMGEHADNCMAGA